MKSKTNNKTKKETNKQQQQQQGLFVLQETKTINYRKSIKNIFRSWSSKITMKLN